MITLDAPVIAFYVLAAVSAFDMPDNSVADVEMFSDRKMTEIECRSIAEQTAKSVEFEVKVGESAMIAAGIGKLKYIRFVCVPVPR